jgi:hypothetical protein
MTPWRQAREWGPRLFPVIAVASVGRDAARGHKIPPGHAPPHYFAASAVRRLTLTFQGLPGAPLAAIAKRYGASSLRLTRGGVQFLLFNWNAYLAMDWRRGLHWPKTRINSLN